MIRPADIIAEVRFLTSAEGGRRGAVRSGYRPSHDMGVDGMLNDGRHEFIDREWLALGETVLSRITFLVPEYQFGRLHVGLTFAIQEGTKVVGHGMVKAVLNEAMRLEA